MSDSNSDQLDSAQALAWIEFCAWSSLVMTPIIWWLQGPSVSDDQFFVRTGLVVLSATVAIGIRLSVLFRKGNAAGDSLSHVGQSDKHQPENS